jgi:hypothetical protein
MLQLQLRGGMPVNGAALGHREFVRISKDLIKFLAY